MSFKQVAEGEDFPNTGYVFGIYELPGVLTVINTLFPLIPVAEGHRKVYCLAVTGIEHGVHSTNTIKHAITMYMQKNKNIKLFDIDGEFLFNHSTFEVKMFYVLENK